MFAGATTGGGAVRMVLWGLQHHGRPRGMTRGLKPSRGSCNPLSSNNKIVHCCKRKVGQGAASFPDPPEGFMHSPRYVMPLGPYYAVMPLGHPFLGTPLKAGSGPFNLPRGGVATHYFESYCSTAEAGGGGEESLMRQYFFMPGAGSAANSLL